MGKVDNGGKVCTDLITRPDVVVAAANLDASSRVYPAIEALLEGWKVNFECEQLEDIELQSKKRMPNIDIACCCRKCLDFAA